MSTWIRLEDHQIGQSPNLKGALTGRYLVYELTSPGVRVYQLWTQVLSAFAELLERDGYDGGGSREQGDERLEHSEAGHCCCVLRRGGGSDGRMGTGGPGLPGLR